MRLVLSDISRLAGTLTGAESRLRASGSPLGGSVGLPLFGAATRQRAGSRTCARGRQVVGPSLCRPMRPGRVLAHFTRRGFLAQAATCACPRLGSPVRSVGVVHRGVALLDRRLRPHRGGDGRVHVFMHKFDVVFFSPNKISLHRNSAGESN